MDNDINSPIPDLASIPLLSPLRAILKTPFIQEVLRYYPT